MLISLEGLEGCGKSTQQRRVLDDLAARGTPAEGLIDPGRTRLGEALREVLLSPDSRISDMTELFLFGVARRQLVHECIRPALAAGRTVVLDRYCDSTTAYQGYGRGLDLALVEEINRQVAGDTWPDLSIIFDVDPEVGLRRRLGARKTDAADGELDRIEQSGLAFLERVREGYLAVAAREPERCVVVSADGDEESVWELVKAVLHERMGMNT